MQYRREGKSREGKSAAQAKFLGFQSCPSCGQEINGAIAAEYVSESHIRHLWWCDNCDQLSRTSTLFEFRPEKSDIPQGKAGRPHYAHARVPHG